MRNKLTSFCFNCVAIVCESSRHKALRSIVCVGNAFAECIICVAIYIGFDSRRLQVRGPIAVAFVSDEVDLAVMRPKVCVYHGGLGGLVSQPSLDAVQVHAFLDEATGECVS